jgi:ribosomal protein L21E
MATAPTDIAVGTTVTFLAGPTRIRHTGVVSGHEGQFVKVDVKNGDKTRTLKTRPGAIEA